MAYILPEMDEWDRSRISVQELDNLFGEYYESHNRNDYFATENKGKFETLCGIGRLNDDDKLKKSIETVSSKFMETIQRWDTSSEHSKDQFIRIFGDFPCFSNLLNPNNAKNIYLQYCTVLVHLYEQRRVPPDHVLAKYVISKYLTWNHIAEAEYVISKYLTWNHIAEALKHQMYPLIGTTMQSAIDGLESDKSFKIEDISPTALDIVITRMQKQKKLSNKEVDFIKNVLRRANEFKMDRRTALNHS